MPLQVKKAQLKVKDGNEYIDGDLLFNVDAQAWAKGTRNGQPVTSGDPTYHNNAKYYVDSAIPVIEDATTTAVNAVNAAATTATANFPQTAAACDTLVGDFAPAYVGNQAYNVGDYVTYQYQLYQCNTDIAANTDSTFVAAHWTQIKLAPEVADLKTLVDMMQAADVNGYYNLTAVNYVPGVFRSNQGITASDKEFVTGGIYVNAGDTVYIDHGSLYLYCAIADASNAIIGYLDGTYSTEVAPSQKTYKAPESGYIYLSVRNASKLTNATAITRADINVTFKVWTLAGENKKYNEKQDAFINQIIDTSYDNASFGTWEIGTINTSNGNETDSTATLRCDPISAGVLKKWIGIRVNSGYKFLVFGWNSAGTFMGWWKSSEFYIGGGIADYFVTEFNPMDVINAGAANVRIILRQTGEGAITIDERFNIYQRHHSTGNDKKLSDIYQSQKMIAEDWHLPFIDVYNALGLGKNHIIPHTATIWSQSGTKDLTQRMIWMSDGIHPFTGTGLTEMYGRTIANQFALISPSYYAGSESETPPYWSGKKLIWFGTSIPAGSDPDAGEGSGATYPELVATQLGATVTNRARGKSCMRINASTGNYDGMIYGHFARALTRTISEVSYVETNWSTIQPKLSGAPSSLSASDIALMQSTSFETLLVPYLDGTNAMPDVFVLDHGRNDIRPKGIDGESDLLVQPTLTNILNGVLADDEYMTANNYANLKLAMDDDLSGITDLPEFAATLNRNCFIGAMNFLITVILRYNPHARIVIVSDYDDKSD